MPDDALAHYLLPDGPVAIQFSGGRSSRYMLHHIVEAHGGTLPADCVVTFANTGRETPETLTFVERVGVHLGIEIAWLERDKQEGFIRVGPGTNRPASTDGEPFEALIRERQFLPNQQTRYCTSELKVRPVKNYMIWLGYERWTAMIGFRADEARRATLTSRSAEKERWQVAFPMIAAGVTKRHIRSWSLAQPFDLGLVMTPAGKTPDGNCDCCFLKSQANRAMVARRRPERAAWWNRMEVEQDGTFDRRISMAELIRSVEQQPDWVFEEGAHEELYCNNALGGCFDDA